MRPLELDINSELISAISALNTTPSAEDILDPMEYISDTIAMVAHAIEHIQAALRIHNDTRVAT